MGTHRYTNTHGGSSLVRELFVLLKLRSTRELYYGTTVIIYSFLLFPRARENSTLVATPGIEFIVIIIYRYCNYTLCARKKISFDCHVHKYLLLSLRLHRLFAQLGFGSHSQFSSERHFMNIATHMYYSTLHMKQHTESPVAALHIRSVRLVLTCKYRSVCIAHSRIFFELLMNDLGQL
jgi:hypothetical protein